MKSNLAEQYGNEDFAATTEGFDSETIAAGNDLVSNIENKSVEALRSKIKAARLEKLMARQLESELSIDEIAFEPTIDDMNDVTEVTMKSEAYRAPRTTMDFAPRRADIDPRSRFKTNRQDCENLLHEFQEHSALMARIADKSNSFLDYLDRIEQEFSSMDSMELELREKTRELDRAEKHRTENRAVIEKQRKQIELLETMRQASADNYEDAKRQLDELQVQNERQAGKLNESNALLSRYEREAVSMNEKYETTRSDYEKATANVASLRRQAHDQDRQLSQVLSEMNELSTENEQNLHELSNLQMKYNDLNKKSLEQQSQHYSRIADLEEVVRDMKHHLDKRDREKTDLTHELEAANNLLILHEEMISALTPQHRS